MLTTFEESDKIFKAFCTGASAYLTKRTPFTKIIEAVLTVHRGSSYMSPTIARKVVEHFAPKKRGHNALRPRQTQIVDGVFELNVNSFCVNLYHASRQACTITSISTANLSACHDNGTPKNPADDFFTADLTITFTNRPTRGRLSLSGAII